MIDECVLLMLLMCYFWFKQNGCYKKYFFDIFVLKEKQASPQAV